MRRADRWLTRSGGFGYLPPEAFELLQLRLRVRRRALWICSPLFVLAAALACSTFRFIGGDESEARFTSRFLLAVGLLTAGFVLATELDRRAGNRIGSKLDQPVIGAEPVPLHRMFGRVRSVCLIITLTMQAALGITLACLSPDWRAGTWAAGFGVACLLGALGIWRAWTRSTIAVDEFSLTIDQRLRSEDAYISTQMLYLLAFAFPVSRLPRALPDWFVLIWIAGFLVVQVLWLVGRERPPWRPVRPMTSDWA